MITRRHLLVAAPALPLVAATVNAPAAIAKPMADHRELLIRYNAWLFRERAWLARAMYPELGSDAERWVPADRLVNIFHNEMPSPSTRAAIVLSAAGVPLVSDF